MADDMDRVIPLDELDDYEIADGDPDVRGWEVRSADGQRIGEVDNLLIDTAAMKVRYLAVDLDDEVGGSDNEDRHILIPIGYAQLHETDDRIVVEGLNSTDVTSLPTYSHEPLTREYEQTVRQSFDRDYTGAPGSDDTEFYAHEWYDQDRFFSRRRQADEPDAGSGRSGL